MILISDLRDRKIVNFWTEAPMWSWKGDAAPIDAGFDGDSECGVQFTFVPTRRKLIGKK